MATRKSRRKFIRFWRPLKKKVFVYAGEIWEVWNLYSGHHYQVLGPVGYVLKVFNNLCAKVFSDQFSFQINGVGNNKMVPGVPFPFSSGGSLTFFTPLINQSQPTIKSSSLCFRFQNTCGTAHRCVIFVLQNELVISLMSLFTIQSFWESIIVLRWVLSFIYVYPRQVQPGGQIESCLLYTEKLIGSSSVIPMDIFATLGPDTWKKYLG